MVGNYAADAPERYGGEGTQESPYGYVIFADYNDTAARDKNVKPQD